MRAGSNNASAGRRLLEEQERASRLQELRARVAEGRQSGPPVPADQLFDRLEAKYRTMIDQQEG